MRVDEQTKAALDSLCWYYSCTQQQLLMTLINVEHQKKMIEVLRKGEAQDKGQELLTHFLREKLPIEQRESLPEYQGYNVRNQFSIKK